MMTETGAFAVDAKARDRRRGASEVDYGGVYNPLGYLAIVY